MRMPARSSSLMEAGRRNILQWSHRLAGGLTMTSGIRQLRERMAELTDLGHAAGLLEGGQQTRGPPRGAMTRAESLATLEKISHDRFIAADTGRLIEAAASEVNGAS